MLAFIVAWEAVRRRGIGRTVLTVLAVLLLASAFIAVAIGGILAEVIALAVILVLASAAARAAFRIHIQLPVADPPKAPVVIWNPKSGGGKATAAHLDVEARARGIEPIQLQTGRRPLPARPRCGRSWSRRAAPRPAATGRRRSSPRWLPNGTCRSPAFRPVPAITSLSTSAWIATMSSVRSMPSSMVGSASSIWPR